MRAGVLSCVRLFATTWTVAHQAPLPVEFSRQQYWRRLQFPTPVGHPDPEIKPKSLASPALAGRFFTTQFSSVQSLSCVRLFETPWIAARQASLSITNSQSLPKLTSIESVMPSSHLILCSSLLLLPPIPPSIQGLFKWVNSSHEVAKVLEFQLQHRSFQWIFRTDFL